MNTTNTGTSSSSSEDLPRHCNNPDCGKLLVRRANEQKAKFLARSHCNYDCSRTNPQRTRSIQSREREKERLETKRQCSICDGDFIRRKDEDKDEFEKREYCSRKCVLAGQVKRRDAEILEQGKTCENPNCRRTFYRVRSKESRKRFEKRRTCSAGCGHAVRIITMGWTPSTQRTIGSGSKKKSKKSGSTLPPVTPLSRDIPDAPPPPPLPEWRPESWSRFPDRRPKVS